MSVEDLQRQDDRHRGYVDAKLETLERGQNSLIESMGGLRSDLTQRANNHGDRLGGLEQSMAAIHALDIQARILTMEAAVYRMMWIGGVGEAIIGAVVVYLLIKK